MTQPPGRCRHGKKLIGESCRACERSVEAGRREFWRDVLFGKYNWRGYTLAEWIAAGYRREDWRAATQETPREKHAKA